ncbi:putative porin [Marinimicrobium sp. ABcell2]|uniref:putative porin n=1 Tax=Marinimicrobium sp. ABcell2 TaxID=3069751 RepID=UPI0027B66472|nr:putative porin [Marinimicrobium sp. ABcell2]MDQ2077597.1 putative porin [Marinimicrobium sp. ABcell2]
MKLKALAIATGMIFSSAVMAAPYQVEVGANYQHWDVDGGGSDGAFGVRGEYHFAPVQTGNHPLAEAAFLERSTNVYAEANDDFDHLTLGGELYIPNTMFYVAAEVFRTDYNGSDTGVAGAVGIMPIDGLLVSTRFTDDGYDANVSVKYVTAIGTVNYLNVEGTYQDGDFDDYLSVSADFYIDRTFSVGAGYADEYGNDVFSLRARKFFTSEISGELQLSDSDWGTGVLVGASIRF